MLAIAIGHSIPMPPGLLVGRSCCRHRTRLIIARRLCSGVTGSIFDTAVTGCCCASEGLATARCRLQVFCPRDASGMTVSTRRGPEYVPLWAPPSMVKAPRGVVQMQGAAHPRHQSLTQLRDVWQQTKDKPWLTKNRMPQTQFRYAASGDAITSTPAPHRSHVRGSTAHRAGHVATPSHSSARSDSCCGRVFTAVLLFDRVWTWLHREGE